MSKQPHTNGHEKRDVSIRVVLWAAVGLVVLIVFTFLAMEAMRGYFSQREARLSPPASPLAEQYGQKLPPEPRLQDQPLRDIEALRAHESALLDGYAWVDREHGTVRIPIERAIELLAERHAKSRNGR